MRFKEVNVSFDKRNFRRVASLRGNRWKFEVSLQAGQPCSQWRGQSNRATGKSTIRLFPG